MVHPTRSTQPIVFTQGRRWRAIVGQLAAMTTPLLLVLTGQGVPHAVYGLLAASATATASLLASATIRNINRWKKQAMAGFEPQSIGILYLAFNQAINMETVAVELAEGRADYERAREILRERQPAAGASMALERD